jgi:hypothetical protein
MNTSIEKHFWVLVSNYYNQNLTINQLNAYSDDVKGIHPKLLKHAFELYRRDPANQFMPRPNQILKYINKESSPESAANEVVGRINYAISRFGYPSPEKAKEYIGELGWLLVERDGGWEEVCRNSDLKTKGIRDAQLRDRALAIIERSSLGILNAPPRLPSINKMLSMKELLNENIIAIEGGRMKENES